MKAELKLVPFLVAFVALLAVMRQAYEPSAAWAWLSLWISLAITAVLGITMIVWGTPGRANVPQSLLALLPAFGLAWGQLAFVFGWVATDLAGDHWSEVSAVEKHHKSGNWLCMYRLAGERVSACLNGDDFSLYPTHVTTRFDGRESWFGVLATDWKPTAQLIDGTPDERTLEDMHGQASYYINWPGEPRDLARARALFEQAAKLGYAGAQNDLGVMYARGRGVPRDQAMAFRWFKAAADQGNFNAQNSVGIRYHRGLGVGQDKPLGALWYERAAAQGLADAQVNLGMLFANGDGVPSDPKRAASLFRQAAEQGNPRGQYHLAMISRDAVAGSFEAAESARWLRVSAHQGYVPSQRQLGLLYARGTVVPADHARAYAWLRLATDNGSEAAREDSVVLRRRMSEREVSDSHDIGRVLYAELSAN